MNWTNFRDKYLFSVNFSIMLAIILYAVRKDFAWHPAVVAVLVLSFLSAQFRELQKLFLSKVGHFNSVILLSTFYYIFFTPFSLLYRVFFRNRAFRKSDSRLELKSSISDFDRPF